MVCTTNPLNPFTHPLGTWGIRNKESASYWVLFKNRLMPTPCVMHMNQPAFFVPKEQQMVTYCQPLHLYCNISASCAVELMVQFSLKVLELYNSALEFFFEQWIVIPSFLPCGGCLRYHWLLFFFLCHSSHNVSVVNCCCFPGSSSACSSLCFWFL